MTNIYHVRSAEGAREVYKVSSTAALERMLDERTGKARESLMTLQNSSPNDSATLHRDRP